MPAHRSRRLLIVVRIEFFAQAPLHASASTAGVIATPTSFARGLRQNRPIADGKECQAKIGQGIPFDDRLRGEAENRIIAVPPREFVEEMRGIFCA